jgi:hypothetical protein
LVCFNYRKVSKVDPAGILMVEGQENAAALPLFLNGWGKDAPNEEEGRKK